MSVFRKITYKTLVKRIASVRSSCLCDTGGTFSTRANGTASTIYALSSGQGKCGVAVVRISGNKAADALKMMTNLLDLAPRKAVLRKIRDPTTKEVIDTGLCLWFPGPHSFTGEDSVEFQVHGGPAILEALMTALSKLKFEPALPGEFTRRAFYNGKLDLTEIEGLADLIHAETEQQRKQALLQADGSLSSLYTKWRENLSHCLAHIEAYIDFSEDDNIEEGVLVTCNQSIEQLVNEISKHLADGRRGEILRSGVRTVIIGEPNVGKSSLFNYLVQRNAAIVTPIAGTTRDIVELNLNISGYPVILADTAGLVTSTMDIVEQEGIRRARVYSKNADFIVLMIDAAAYVSSCLSFEDFLCKYVNTLQMRDTLYDANGHLIRNCIIVVNKIDLISDKDLKIVKDFGAVAISCAEEQGLHKLLDGMAIKFRDICGDPSRENPTISQARHRTHLTNSVEFLKDYLVMSSREQYDMVLAAQKVRNSMRELGKITGHVSTEEILDIIFTNFCIGK